MKKLNIKITMALLLAPFAAQAETSKLKFSTMNPPNHYIVVQGVQNFADGVTEKTNGDITFEIYPSAQLGKDIPALMKSGVIEAGHFAVSLHPGRFPRSSVVELPGAITSSCDGNAKIEKIIMPGSDLHQKEYDKADVRVVSVGALPPYQLFTTNKPIEKVEDIKGLRVWANGPAMEKTLLSLGANPVKIPSQELFEAVSRGTIDAAMINYPIMLQYGLEDYFKHTLEDTFLGSGFFVFALSQKTWQGLTTEQQAIVESEAKRAQDYFCDWIDADQASKRKQVSELGGFTVHRFNAEEQGKIDAILSSIASEWAKDLDASGFDGTKTLSAFRGE